ncbi:MAG: hypothetical protein H0U27_04880, partial [Nitrosopumilus sp.]|nr:hypothetical protein [Nitrosopumilus sp.]
MQINDHHINGNQNSIFCPPEPGKPNPYEDRVIGQLRSRIVRHGQKGNTCIYTAMQILLDEAKNPKYERSLGEKLLAKHRKELTEWSKKWNPIQELITAININHTRCTKATAPFLLQVLEKTQEK